MTNTFEITGKFDTESDCHKLLYNPITLPLKYPGERSATS